jgi:type I restriction enzyme S subunit
LLADLLVEQKGGDWGDDTGEAAIRVLRSTNFTDRGMLEYDNVAVRHFSLTKSQSMGLRTNDLLVERSGGGPAQPVGRVGFIDRDLPDHWFSNFVQMLRPDSDKIDPTYLRWVLLELNRSGIIERLQHQTTQMRNLDFRDYLRLYLPRPPGPEQEAIAQVLKTANEAIVAAEAKLTAARRLKIAVVQQLFTRGIPGRHRRFKQTKVGDIPEAWDLKSLAQHCGGPQCVKTGPFGAQLPEEVYAADGVPMANITDIGEGELNLTSGFFVRQDVFDRLKDYSLVAGDVLFSRVASVGRLALINKEHEPLLMSSNCIRLRPGTAFNSKFLTHIFHDAESVGRQVAAMSNAGARPLVTPRFLRRMQIPCPPRDEQDEIASVIASTESAIKAVESEIDALTRLKGSLLQNLLTGRIRMSRK